MHRIILIGLFLFGCTKEQPPPIPEKLPGYDETIKVRLDQPPAYQDQVGLVLLPPLTADSIMDELYPGRPEKDSGSLLGQMILVETPPDGSTFALPLGQEGIHAVLEQAEDYRQVIIQLMLHHGYLEFDILEQLQTSLVDYWEINREQEARQAPLPTNEFVRLDIIQAQLEKGRSQLLAFAEEAAQRHPPDAERFLTISVLYAEEAETILADLATFYEDHYSQRLLWQAQQIMLATRERSFAPEKAPALHQRIQDWRDNVPLEVANRHLILDFLDQAIDNLAPPKEGQ